MKRAKRFRMVGLVSLVMLEFMVQSINLMGGQADFGFSMSDVGSVRVSGVANLNRIHHRH